MKVPQNFADAIVDPLAYAEVERVDEALRWLRREAPLARIEPRGYEPFWTVTRHADILEVERQNELFHNADRSVTVISMEAERSIRQLTGGSPHLNRNLTRMDNPDHFAHRRIAQGVLLPQKLREREPRIRAIAREFVDRMAEFDGRCDFARDIAFLYPLRVLMEIMGLPASDEPLMLKLTQQAFSSTDPDLNRSGKQVSDAERVADLHRLRGDVTTYFTDIANDRRKCPRDDLASVLANAKVHGEPLKNYELVSYYGLVATAGHDTTSNTIAGGAWALAENANQFAKLKAAPELIRRHVEESVRWETVVKHFMRTATADTELRGQKIAKGDWLMLCYLSGNRDEAVFNEPYQYDVGRTPNKHVAFGYGAHICLGQHLGRLEMQIFWEELLPRLESLELDGTPTRTKANFVSGPKSVPIRYRMN
ncbi:cytochrome P450 [Bradyrhizobium sp. HKCCYLS20291]|uniref:cytochrome P450 n=1 Tax=Bradyrhizobium sp. HKCCYLS20291 TaxID=3420766 RepID=UPI003EB871FC